MEKEEVENFKKLFLDMHRGFPNWIYSKHIEDVIRMEEVRENLIEKGFLIREKHIYIDEKDGKRKEGYWYMLGPNGLTLVSSWKNEELSNEIKNFTYILVLLTGLLFGLGLYQIFQYPEFSVLKLIISFSIATMAIFLGISLTSIVERKS